MNNIALKIEKSNGVELHAELHLPNNRKPDYYAIFVHCFECSSSSSAPRNVSRALNNHGFAVLRFDLANQSGRTGEADHSSISDEIRNLEDVYLFMKKEYEAPALLVGHSLGGTVALMVGARFEEVKAIATIGAPSTTPDVFTHITDLMGAEKESVGMGVDTQRMNAGPSVDNENTTNEVLNIVKKMRKKALLVMHSPVDRVVSPDHAHQLFITAFHPKSFVALNGADHLLTKDIDSIYAGNVIASWASRFLPPRARKSLDIESEQLVAHLNVIEDQYTTSVQLNNHFLTVDEPNSAGGRDYGPSPYELLISSLAACTAMTLKLYAERKKWDLKEVFVYSNHAKKHARDIDGDRPEYLDHICKRLVLVGDLTNEQQLRLLEIAERCPVHRTLQGNVVVETTLTSGSDFYTRESTSETR